MQILQYMNYILEKKNSKGQDPQNNLSHDLPQQ